MKIDEAIRILDPETSKKALLPYAYDIHQRRKVVDEACRVAVDELRKRQWISVKDRLPAVQGLTLTAFGERSHSDNVLVTDGTDVYFGYFIACDGFDAKKNKKNITFVSEGNYQAYNVTHWQPLPVPPNEREENVR